jgi:hypothetical protein
VIEVNNFENFSDHVISELIDEWLYSLAVDENNMIKSYEKDENSNSWCVRMQGISKDVITVWLFVKDRTLHVETHFMPAPEKNIEECFRYLLKKNAGLIGPAFCLGAESAIYLTERISLTSLSLNELDRILGCAWAYTEECFATAMQIGFKGSYVYRARKKLPKKI